MTVTAQDVVLRIIIRAILENMRDCISSNEQDILGKYLEDTGGYYNEEIDKKE